MNFYNYRLESLNLSSTKERSELEAFLEKQGLLLESDLELCLVLRTVDTERIVATASASGKLIKDVAVEAALQGEGLSNRLLSEMIHLQRERGFHQLFVFTKNENIPLFQDLGFYLLVQIPQGVGLLENSPTNLSSYLTTLQKTKGEAKDVGAIVVNANPFTLGHQYLIEKAASECERLHVFVLWEDASVFPNTVRFELVKKGTEHLKNVVLHQGRDYVISRSTFPSYFLKENDKILETHARLDLELFAKSLAPALGVKKRYVGEEPYCLATKTYNKIMKEYLPTQGISVFEIPRKEAEHEVISASTVRALLREDKKEEIRRFVPETTWQFLVSPEAEAIIAKIKKSLTRH